MSSMQQNNSYLLIDCNAFFVSCEQVFNPKLVGKPVVVLSNNDGCVVSRSKEAKTLGIPMGAPAFQYAELFKAQGVHVLSSNFPLYGDMSRRVMQTLHHLSPDVEEYSVDEAFVIAPPQEAESIKKRIFRDTGIPVSIGSGKTKTLAKVANDLAKKLPSGILDLPDAETVDRYLEKIPPSDIWGVGRRLEKSLREEKIYTALELKNASDLWIQKRFSVVLLRTVMELRGVPCLTLEEVPEIRKSLTCSRSFGKKVTELSELEEAISHYISSAAEKLRREGLVASHLTVFINTSAFLKPPAYYANGVTSTLPEPTAYTPFLIQSAKKALLFIYRKGFLYKRAGVVFSGITLAHLHQLNFLSEDDGKKKKAMKLLDEVNQAFESPKLFFAAEGIKKSWKAQRENTSPRYTTRWDELLTLDI
jgi:DNA polymerase V